jgi:hypothetical protein
VARGSKGAGWTTHTQVSRDNTKVIFITSDFNLNGN